MTRVAICLALIACLAAFPACGASNEGGELDGSGYTLRIADGWEDTTATAPSVDDLGFEDPAAVAIDVEATITGEESDGFAPNLAIVTTPAPGRTKALALARQNLRTTRAQPELPPGAGGGAIDASGAVVEETDLGGEPAGSFEQLVDAPQGEVRQLQLYAVQGGTAYALTYSGLASGQFEERLPEVEAMLSSWEWR